MNENQGTESDMKRQKDFSFSAALMSMIYTVTQAHNKWTAAYLDLFLYTVMKTHNDLYSDAGTQ